jgi:hypothetical protein
MRLANDWCLRVKCMCPPLHVYDHLMEEFAHMCHMHSNIYSISCISTFLVQKIFAMIEGVTFLVNLKYYRAAFNCSWIVTSLNLLPISAFFSLWIREMLHGKFWTTYMFVTRNSITDREDWAGQLPLAYKAWNIFTMLLPVGAIEHLNSNVGSQFVPPEKISVGHFQKCWKRSYVIHTEMNWDILSVLIVNHQGYLRCDDGLLQCENRTVALFQCHTYKPMFLRLWTWTPKVWLEIWSHFHSLHSNCMAICCMFRCYAKILWHYSYEISSMLPKAWTVLHFFPWTCHFIYITFSCLLPVTSSGCSAWLLVGSKKSRRDWNCERERSTSDLHFWFKV